MEILIYTLIKEDGNWAKELLNSFGKGLHITVATPDDLSLLHTQWDCILWLGVEPELSLLTEYELTLTNPKDEESQNILKRELWIFYRDYISERMSVPCSCGLYDWCHCH